MWYWLRGLHKSYSGHQQIAPNLSLRLTNGKWFTVVSSFYITKTGFLTAVERPAFCYKLQMCGLFIVTIKISYYQSNVDANTV